MRSRKSSVAVGLGWFSIGLGLMELFSGRRLAARVGIEHNSGLVRMFGVREIVSGIGLLAARRARPWLWARFAGDLLDLRVLGSALSPRNPRRDDAALAAAAVLGIALLDLTAGVRHS